MCDLFRQRGSRFSAELRWQMALGVAKDRANELPQVNDWMRYRRFGFVGKGGSAPPEASPSILFREPDGSQILNFGNRQRARADDADQGERLGGVHAVLYPPAIAVLKQGEGEGGGFGIKDGIKQAGRKGKVLVRQQIIAGFDPSRPSHRLSC